MKVLGVMDSLKILTEAMDQSDSVFYTRFGDNDVMQMSGSDQSGKSLLGRKMGGNRTVWSPELQLEITKSFNIDNRNYFVGLSGDYPKEEGMKKGLFEPFPYKEALINKVYKLTFRREFLNPVLFHYLISFKPFIFDNFCANYLKPSKKMFIGSVKKGTAEKVLGNVDYYIESPIANAYSCIEMIWDQVKENINNVDVVIPNCGQATRAIQHRIWEHNKNVWSLDLGSIFDPLEGRKSRTCWKMVGNRISERYK